MKRHGLECVFNPRTRAGTVWSVIEPLLFPGATSLSVYEQQTSLEDFRAELGSGERSHFDVILDDRSARFTLVRNFAHAVLTVESDVPISEAEELVPGLLAHGLLSARLFNPEYEYWQNAEDPLEYAAHGRSTEGLTMTTDPVFGDPKIDVSTNPGRRSLRPGYVEAIGERMWITGSLLSLLGLTSIPEDRPGCYQVRDHGAFCVVESNESFATAHSRRCQEQMRRDFFPS